MSWISRLDIAESDRIRSGVVIPDFVAGVKGLLANSLEAGATNVELRIDPSSLSVLCKDNGQGISTNALQYIGEHGMTSKGVGHTGEVISLLRIMSNLIVITRSEETPFTYVSDFKLPAKVYQDLKYSGGNFGIGKDPFPTSGTAIIVTNMFYNVPVRRMQLLQITKHKLEHDIREAVLESMMEKNIEKLISLQISIVSSDKCLLPLLELSLQPNCKSMPDLLLDIFGFDRGYVSFEGSSESIKFTGVVSRSLVQTKRYQFVFIDEHRVEIPRLNSRIINLIFDNVNLGIDSTPTSSPIKGGQNIVKSTGKPYLKYPVFMIKCSGGAAGLLVEDQKGKLLQAICDSLKNLVAIHSLRVHVSPRKRAKIFPQELPSKRRPRIFSSLYASPAEKRTPDNEFIPKHLIRLLDKDHICDSANVVECMALYHIPKDGFKKQEFRVIRQIDKKFIMMTMLITRVRDEKVVPVLMLLDQHACDERIRVEELFKEFIENIADPNVTIASRLDQMVIFDVASSQISMFDFYRTNFAKFGIHYKISNETIEVTHLPEILLGRNTVFLRQSLLQHCYDLDAHSKLEHFDFSINNWFRGISHLPRVLIDAINTKACRTAIMFGDILDHREVNHMLQSLAQCHLPFQCAHGRPSVIPLVELNAS